MFQVKTESTQREEILDKGVSDTAILSFYFSFLSLSPTLKLLLNHKKQ